jgi:hypothetical protein
MTLLLNRFALSILTGLAGYQVIHVVTAGCNLLAQQLDIVLR